MASVRKPEAGQSEAGKKPPSRAVRLRPSIGDVPKTDGAEKTAGRDAKKAADSDLQFRTIFKNVADGILIADIQTKRFCMANPAFCRMSGYTLEEATRLSVADIHPPESLPEVLRQFARQTRQEQSLARDIPVRRKDGSVFYADVNAFPITLSGRTCLMGLFRDVTERRKAEERLKESEGRFRSVMEQSSEGIILTDEKGQVIEWNSAQEEITARSRDTVLGKPLWEVLHGLVPPEIRSSEVGRRLRSSIAEACRTGQAQWFDRLQEHEVARRDGTRRCLQILTYPIRVDNGFRIGVACRDVTAKKAVERALRESEEKYRTLVESAGEAIATVNKDGVFLFMNRMAAAQLGGTPTDYIGKTMWNLFPKAIADAQMAGVWNVIKTGQGMNAAVLTEVRGQRRWYSTTLEPIRDAEGRVTAALVVARDIHEVRQARQELEDYRDRMARAEQLASLGTLSATIAHELTQPLTVSRLSLQEALAELRELGSSEAVMEALQESLDGISDAACRIEQFRNFARQSSKEPPSRVELGDVVSRTIKLLEGKARECDMSLTAQGMDDLPAIMANEKSMEQMCFALVENAIQAARHQKGRRLVVTGSTAGQQISLRFEDNCGGIPPEHLDKVLRPFFTTKAPGEGTGLGLCIVDRLVTQAGGKIRIKNTPGEGVAFCITLPVDKP